MLHTLYLIRHGESTANVGGPAVPDKQVVLTERGHEQAQGLAERLSHVHTSAVYTSELQRTQQTAAPLCEQWELLPQVLPCLNELCQLEFAHIANVSVDERRRMAQAYWALGDVHHRDGPTADSFAMFAARVDDFLGMAATLPNHSLLFTHGIWIGMLAWKLLGFEVKTGPDMQQFRQFQTAMNMKNTVVYRLQIDSNTGLKQLSYHC